MSREFVGPWPHSEMWWCLCAKSDCGANLFGPFPDVDGANREAEEAQTCRWPHVALRGEPPLDSPIHLGYGLAPISQEAQKWRSWFKANRLIEETGEAVEMDPEEERKAWEALVF